MKKEKRETIKQVINNIQFAQEYIMAVGEKHKDAYVDILEWSMKELMRIIKK